MPHSKQAKKRLRQSAERREQNKAVGSAMKSAIKKVFKLTEAGDLEGARKLLPLAMKKIDKAAKRQVIKPNNAARKKSRVSRAVRDLGKKPAS
ncbi:MAG: 30S ribosomal protein S20 [Planctomycetota bacterium]